MSQVSIHSTKKDVLELLKEHPQGLHLSVIANELGVSPKREKALLAQLDTMVFEGLLRADVGLFFCLPQKNSRKISGPGREDLKKVHHAQNWSVGFTEEGEKRKKVAKKKKKESSGEVDLPAKQQKIKRSSSTVAFGRGPSKSLGKKKELLRLGGSRERRKATEKTGEKLSGKLELQGNAAREEMRVGKLSVHPKGFGFVTSKRYEGDDVFIPEDKLCSAMHGDEVKVRITGNTSKGKEGVVVDILSRGQRRVAGILRRKRGHVWVELDDLRLRGPLLLSESDMKGEHFGEDGDAVVAEIVSRPETPYGDLFGKLLHILGKPGTLLVEAKKILLVAGVTETHSDKAISEAERYGEDVPSSMLEGRLDLTHLPLPTIDPEDARDHDDAIWVEKRENGAYVAWIAIADVSSYVRPGSALNEEAKARGCSLYLPDRAIPMLPPALSSNLCSLLPGRVRLCLCVEVELDAFGIVQSTRIHRAFMKSSAKLSYEQVADILGLDGQSKVHLSEHPMKPYLQAAFDLSRKLREQRLKRGSLDFDLPEPKVVFGKDGALVDIKKRTQNAGVKLAYQLVEELMLLANEEVARFLVQHSVPAIFRVHGAPDQAKLARFMAMCNVFGLSFDLEDAKDPRALSAFVTKMASHPASSVLNMLLLRSMKQAAYETENTGHFGLASEAYVHFTSPIRRYPDLLVHRSVHAVLLHERIDRGEKAIAVLDEAAKLTSSAERQVMEVERQVLDLYRVSLMKRYIGHRFRSNISSFVGAGIYVTIDEPYVDVFIKNEDIGFDFALHDDGLRMVSRLSGETIKLGDTIDIEIADALLSKRVVYGLWVRSERKGQNRSDLTFRKVKAEKKLLKKKAESIPKKKNEEKKKKVHPKKRRKSEGNKAKSRGT